MPTRHSPRQNARRAVFVFLLAISGVLSSAACGSATPEPRDVTVVSEDGFKLAATLYGKGTNGVVLVPDTQSTKADLEQLASDFANKSMTAIAVNPRGFPGSDGVRDYQIMDRDLAGAARFLKTQQSVSKIAYVGVGTGGTVAYKAAANPDLIPSSLVAISSPLKYQTLDATKSAMQMFMPKMLVESADNKDALEQARETLKVFPDPKRLEEVAGTARSTELLNAPENGSIRALIVDYIKKAFA